MPPANSANTWSTFSLH